MSPTLIARDEDDNDALIGWWRDGDALGSEARLICAMDEAALVFGDGELLAQLGPGSHSLTAETQPELADYLVDEGAEAEVAFVKTRAQLNFLGALDPVEDDEQHVTFAAELRGSFVAVVNDPAMILELSDELDEDTSVEDYLIEQVFAAASEAYAADPPSLFALARSGGTIAGLAEATQAAANEVVAEHGVEVQVTSPLGLRLDEAGSKAVAGLTGEDTGDETEAPLAPPPRPAGAPRQCGDCSALSPATASVCGSCGAMFE
jgi:hypothetical protein